MCIHMYFNIKKNKKKTALKLNLLFRKALVEMSKPDLMYDRQTQKTELAAEESLHCTFSNKKRVMCSSW